MNVYQGKIALDGSTKINCTDDYMNIVSMIINNVNVDYIITVTRFETGPGIHEVPVYRFQLNAGDSVRDTNIYKLSKGDYIRLDSTEPNTTYYILTE